LHGGLTLFSASAAHLSDRLLWVTIGVPALRVCSPEEAVRAGSSPLEGVAWAVVPQASPAGVAALAVF